MKSFFATLAAAVILAGPVFAADVMGKGTLNEIKAEGQKVNLSHEPIPELSWPAMTMDLKVAPGVDLSGLKPGTPVTFSLEKGEDGIFQVKSIEEKK